MAKNQLWNDDYWLLLMQLYLRKPVGVKPMYSREMVALSLELHIAPPQLYQRQKDIANLETPRIERIWKEYSQNPQRLTRAVRRLREMKVSIRQATSLRVLPLKRRSRATSVL